MDEEVVMEKKDTSTDLGTATSLSLWALMVVMAIEIGRFRAGGR